MIQVKTNKKEGNKDTSISSNNAEQFSNFVTEVKENFKIINKENYYAAAILVVRESNASASLLESYFGWGAGYAHDVLTYLERKKIIGQERLFHDRKILVKEDSLFKLLSVNTPNRKKTNNGWIKRAYIEIQVLTDNVEPTYDTFNLNPDIAIHFQVGDKWIIKRDRIEQSGFFGNIICNDHRLIFHQKEMSYFSNHSNICFIQIVERLFNEDCLELHGKVIPEDGEFYE